MRKKPSEQQNACPCGSGQTYANCCARFIEAGQHAETAEQLMRSRYSAYVLQREDYLLRTWHVSTRPMKLNMDKVHWLGLQLRRTQAGGASDREGIVEFVARYKRQGRAERLHETSRFVREAGQWFYVEALGATEKPALSL